MGQTISIGHITYRYVAGVATVIGSDNPPTNWELIIPSTITVGSSTYEVTSIGDNAFENETNLLNVFLPDTVISISAYAFKGCTNLTSINIGAGVQNLYMECFLNCPLNAIYFQSPNTLNIIESDLFSPSLYPLTVTYYYAPGGYNDLNDEMKELQALYFTTATISYQASCFNKGTKILCLENDAEKWMNVDDLALNTLVKTYLHGYKKVKRIGSGSFVNNPENHLFCMYKLSKEDDPELIEDLILTGQHSILVDTYKDRERVRTKQLGFQETIDDKKLLLAFVGNKFKKMMDSDTYEFYNFALESETGDQRFGVYANGILCETPSINSIDKKENEFRTFLKCN